MSTKPQNVTFATLYVSAREANLWNHLKTDLAQIAALPQAKRQSGPRGPERHPVSAKCRSGPQSPRTNPVTSVSNGLGAVQI